MPSAVLFYQYFHPDDVVSSVHLTELAEGLVRRGWSVTAMPCNRSCRNDAGSYPPASEHSGIQIRRIWRPAFAQSSTLGRLANCAWMIAAWSMQCFRHNPDVLIIGTDPILSVMTGLLWKAFRPKTKIAHWCFDLYPEAAMADGILRPGFALSLLQKLVRQAYKSMDLIVDIGDCMRKRLESYSSPARYVTLPPWALAEPNGALSIDLDQRELVFGKAKLGLLYSGTFGRAHSFSEILNLAREMRDVDAHFSFGVRGNRVEELRASIVAEDVNISFAPFVSQDQLEARLSSADVHIVSLREEWTGTVVPSKFFGAIAAGRPILFVGSEDSYIARTIRRFDLGWVCTAGNERTLARELRKLAENPFELRSLHEHCHRVYQDYFSRTKILDGFDRELRGLLDGKRMDPVVAVKAEELDEEMSVSIK